MISISRIKRFSFDSKSSRLGYYFFPPLAAMVLLAILSLYSIRDIRRNELASRLDRQASSELNAVLENLLDTETGFRGFLLTDDMAYLEPFYIAKPQIKAHFENIYSLIDDVQLRDQINEAHVLSSEKLSLMTSAIELANQGKKSEALEFIVSGRSKEVMDSIRELLKNTEVHFKRRILAGDTDSWNAYFKATALASIAVSVAVISIIWSLLRVDNEFEYRRVSDSLVRKRSSQLQSFADIASRLVAGKDIDSIIRIALNEFRLLIGAREALIQIKTGNMTRIERSVVASGVQELSEDHLACIFQVVNAISQGEKTYFRRRPEILRLEHVTLMRAWAVCGHAVDNMLSAPIVDGTGQEVGRFVLLGKYEEDFNANDASIVSQLAYTLSVAIDNAKLSEQARQAALKKDEFLAMLGHELRNPLAGILTGSEALLSNGEAGEERDESQKLCQAIYRQSCMMKHMVDDLLDVSRIGRGKISLKKRRCNLVQIIEELVCDYRKSYSSREIVLERDPSESRLVVYGDPVRLAQSVTNLLHNACKFSPDHSKVIVRIIKEVDELLGTQSIVVMVVDEGIGLSEHELNSIFELFYQSDTTIDRTQGGLGIGLTLAKGLIDMHDGRIMASSAGKGCGATFTIRLTLLPDSIDDLPEAPTEIQHQNVSSERLRILAIDDRADALLPIKILMSRDGHEVLEAHNGELGVELAIKTCPNLILCDIGLPGSLSGYDVAKEIRRSDTIKSTYLVALSGYSQPIDFERSRLAGFDYHVAKPVDLATLRNICSSKPRFTDTQ